MSEEKAVLYRFCWPMRRSADVVGIFAALPSRVASHLGKECHLGEIAGKHSEVSGVLEEKDLTILTDDQEFIAKAKQYKLVPVGPNPLEYIEDREADEAYGKEGDAE